jgi:hypothetical protein
MQYIRRRIQRVSGVTVRDERVESRDFSPQPAWENWDSAADQRGDSALSQRKAGAYDRIGAAHRERT